MLTHAVVILSRTELNNKESTTKRNHNAHNYTQLNICNWVNMHAERPTVV